LLGGRFLEPHVINLNGKPEVNGVADAVEQTPGSSEMLLISMAAGGEQRAFVDAMRPAWLR
jgi:hypothetical protein